MVRERIPMYNVLEVLRQRYQEKVSSVRKIAQSVNMEVDRFVKTVFRPFLST